MTTRLILSAAALAAFLLPACSSSKTPGGIDPTTAQPASTSSGTWTVVSESPLTLFPAGVPADHPTDALSGSWVTTDGGNTRLFIPKDPPAPHSEAALSAQALALKNQSSTWSKKVSKSSSVVLETTRGVATATVLAPVNLWKKIRPGSGNENAQDTPATP